MWFAMGKETWSGMEWSESGATITRYIIITSVCFRNLWKSWASLREPSKSLLYYLLIISPSLGSIVHQFQSQIAQYCEKAITRARKISVENRFDFSLHYEITVSAATYNFSTWVTFSTQKNDFIAPLTAQQNVFTWKPSRKLRFIKSRLLGKVSSLSPPLFADDNVICHYLWISSRSWSAFARGRC